MKKRTKKTPTITAPNVRSADTLIEKIKRHPILAPIIALGTIIGGILTLSNQLQDAWSKISPSKPAHLELSILGSDISEINFHALNSGDIPTSIKEVRINSVISPGTHQEIHKTSILVTQGNVTIEPNKSVNISAKTSGNYPLPALLPPDTKVIAKDVGLDKYCSLDVIYSDFQEDYKTSSLRFYCLPK